MGASRRLAAVTGFALLAAPPSGCSRHETAGPSHHLPQAWHAAHVDPEKGGRFLPERNRALLSFQDEVVRSGAAIPYPHFYDSGTIVVAVNSSYPYSVRRLRTLLDHERRDPDLSVVVISDEPPDETKNRLGLQELAPTARITVVHETTPYSSHASFPFLRDYAPVLRVRPTATGLRTAGLVVFRGSSLNKVIDAQLGIRSLRDAESLSARFKMTRSLAAFYAERLPAPIAIDELDLQMDGGNLITDGRGTCFFSRILLQRNSQARSSIERELREKLGCIRSIFLPAPQRLDLLQHVDTMLYFADPQNVILSMPTFYESDLGREYQSLRELLNLGYRVHRVPRKTASITYTNILTTRRHVYVPQYSVYKVESDAQLSINERLRRLDLERDREQIARALRRPVETVTLPADSDVERDNRRALEVLQRLQPDKSVVGVASDETVQTLGSWHCISHELPEAL